MDAANAEEGIVTDTTLGLTVDREPPPVIDLPQRKPEPVPGRGIVYGVVIGTLIWLVIGLTVLLVREVMRWAGS